MKNILLLTVLSLVATFSVNADSNVSCTYDFTDQTYKTGFIHLKAKAISAGKRLCLENASYNNSEIKKIIVSEFIESIRTEMKVLLPPSVSTELKSFLDKIKQTGKATSYVAGEDDNEDPILYYSSPAIKITLPDSKAEECKVINEKYNVVKSIDGLADCVYLIDNLRAALNPFTAPFNIKISRRNLELLKDYDNAWDKYLTEARSQTLLDMVVTSRMNKDYYNETQLRKPHSLQYFLFHPSVVYEKLPDKKPGEKDDVSLALELVGMNCWDCKIPIGASVGWVYADRANAKSTSGALMIHLYNNYTIGYSNRDDEDGGKGYFISIDLLKAFFDKKQQLSDLKAQIKSNQND